MRRRPTVDPSSQRIAPAANIGPQRPPPATFEGAVIEPFLASGGSSYFLSESEPVTFQPQEDGVQLITSVYFPRGRVGFLKELRVAPFLPPVFADPWTTSGVDNATTSWRSFDSALTDFPRPGATNGVWTTPFGWENYFDSEDPNAVIPQWVWVLTILQGTLQDHRGHAGPFDMTDPSTWYLAPNVAVPASAYPNGIPGDSPSGFWPAQRMQVLQGDKLSSHVVCPEHSTLCLFARWRQQQFDPRATIAVEGNDIVSYGPLTYPLLPSFGQLHGYMQAVSSEQSIENSQFGWGG